MSLFDDILQAARAAPAQIVLSEGEDKRILAGAAKAREDGLAHPILVGREKIILAGLSDIDAAPKDFELVDPSTFPRADDYAQSFLELRRHKGATEETAAAAMRDPLQFAAMMVRKGEAEGSIGGAVATTGDTVRAALQIIGRAERVKTVSSFFLMLLDQDHHPKKGIVVFADCALIVEPSEEELAQIALSSASSFAALTGNDPRVALLSFSTAGSAKHERVSRVAHARALVEDLAPDLIIDGDIQFDAAFVPDVAAKKAQDSPLAGDANVFVFPSLEAANIGYKIAQRIGHAQAIGPILQGLASPANDLSRGCSAEDVTNLLAVTSLQAKSLDLK